MGPNRYKHSHTISSAIVIAGILMGLIITEGSNDTLANPDDRERAPPPSPPQSPWLSFDIVEPAEGQAFTQKDKLKIMTRVSLPGVHSIHALESTISGRYTPPLSMCVSINGDFSTDAMQCSSVKNHVEIDLITVGEYSVTAWLEDGIGVRLSAESSSRFVVNGPNDKRLDPRELAQLEVMHAATISATSFFVAHEAHQLQALEGSQRKSMAVWPEILAYSRGIDCTYNECTARQPVLAEWPFTYFLTTPMLRHTQEFQPIMSMLLHLPTLSHRLVVNYCSLHEAADGMLDMAQLLLKATQVLSKGKDGSSSDSSPNWHSKRLYITASAEFEAHPCRRHDDFPSDAKVRTALQLMPPHLQHAVPFLERFGDMVASLLRPTSFCIDAVHIGANLTTTVVARPRTASDTPSSNASMYFSILGERNSATTWVGKLFADNSSPEVLQQVFLTDWKHDFVRDYDLGNYRWPLKRALFVVCVKSPLAWAVSMYDSPFHSAMPEAEHRTRSLAEFLAAPWRTNYTRSVRLKWHEGFTNVASFRTAKLRSHLLNSSSASFDPGVNLHVIRYEDVLSDPRGSIESLLARYDVKIARHDFLATAKKMSGSGSQGSTSARFDRKSYYLKEEFRLRYDRAAYDAYVPELDADLESFVGYSLPTWEDVRATHARDASDVLSAAWFHAPQSRDYTRGIFDFRF